MESVSRLTIPEILEILGPVDERTAPASRIYGIARWWDIYPLENGSILVVEDGDGPPKQMSDEFRTWTFGEGSYAGTLAVALSQVSAWAVEDMLDNS